MRFNVMDDICVLHFYKIHSFRIWVRLREQACKTGKPRGSVSVYSESF